MSSPTANLNEPTLPPGKSPRQPLSPLSLLAGLFTLYFLIALLIIGASVLFIQQRTEQLTQARLRGEAELRMQLAGESLLRDIRTVIGHVHVLATSFGTEFDTEQPDQERLLKIQQRLQRLMLYDTNYDQLRYIDNAGMEQVRVNRDAKDVVPAAELQDKHQRYYVQAGKMLVAGESYLSALDLNIEHGQIEIPYKPVLRVVEAVFDSRGIRHGMIVANYLGIPLLQRFQREVDAIIGEPMLLDHQGNWLWSRSHRFDWGNSLSHGMKFGKLYPDVWGQLQQNGTTPIAAADHRLFLRVNLDIAKILATPETGQNVRIVSADSSRIWYILSEFNPQTRLTALLEYLQDNEFALVPLVFSTMIACAFLAWFRSRNILTQRQLKLISAVFENTNDAVLITDTSYKILSVNPAFTRITGFAKGEVLGETPRLWRSTEHPPEFYKKLWRTVDQNGFWQGEMVNRRKNGELYPAWENISEIRDDRNNITHYVAVFSDISSIKDTENRLKELAHYDQLTGLPNRLLFLDRLNRELAWGARHHHRFSLLFLDLDRFKLINDSLGHAAGDELLVEVAKRLQTCVRDEDTVARLGGDEFTVILRDVQDVTDAARVAKKILQVFNRPFHIANKAINSSTSIGICTFPDDADNASALLKAADMALYESKATGRGSYSFYRSELTAKANEKMQIEQGLRQALAEQKIQVFFQPQVDLLTGDIVGVEALARWHHPSLGWIPPTTFVHIAEESGLMSALGDTVMRQSCKEIQILRAAGLRHLRMSVNVSGIQLLRANVAETISNLVKSFDIPLDHIQLVLEITESVLHSAEAAIANMQELRKMGIGIAIDDFGSGYSSLSHLKRLPVTTLKIDRAFVADIPGDNDDESIVSAIVAIGRQMNLHTIAEGIETLHQLAFLRRCGCAEGQGYLFSPAIPGEQLLRLLQDDSSLQKIRDLIRQSSFEMKSP